MVSFKEYADFNVAMEKRGLLVLARISSGVSLEGGELSSLNRSTNTTRTVHHRPKKWCRVKLRGATLRKPANLALGPFAHTWMCPASAKTSPHKGGGQFAVFIYFAWHCVVPLGLLLGAPFPQSLVHKRFPRTSSTIEEYSSAMRKESDTSASVSTYRRKSRPRWYCRPAR